MVKVSYCVAAVLCLSVIAHSTARANDTQVYKLIVNGKVVKYGTMVNGDFHGCDGFPLPKPAGASVVAVSGACPSDEDASFAPQSGHYPKETPTPKPRHK
jgi:hypothetical protein